MEEYYTLKQYLLSLREEYKYLENEMKKLKKYISFKSKKVENTKFSFTYNPEITRIDNNLYRYTLLCHFEIKRNLLKRKINSILKHIDGFDFNTSKIYESYYNINENEFKRFLYNKCVIIKDKEICQTEVMRILNSNEFNALSCNCYINGINNLEQYIDVTPFYIKLIKNNNALFDYRLTDDTISFDNNFKINYNNVTELLNTKIPTNEIFDFQKEAIKKSKTKDKEIIFIGNKSHNTFKLCEEEHKVLIKSLPKNTTK